MISGLAIQSAHLLLKTRLILLAASGADVDAATTTADHP